jgi:DUF1016 N-terminal domain
MVNLLPNEQFLPVLEKIQQARQKAYSQVNAVLVELYWHIGQYIYQQIAHQGWGKAVVVQLAHYIRHNEPGQRFRGKNLWRMKQFYKPTRIKKNSPHCGDKSVGVITAVSCP